jgi:membrane protein required for colicin V production
MPVTVLDIVVIVVVLISAILAMVRGFVREVLSVASWAAAAAAAYFFYKPVLPLVKPYFESQNVATIVAAAIIFFVALIVASYITMKISDFVIDSRIGAIDRALGFVFGAVRGLLLLVVAFLFFNWLVNPAPAWVANAKTRPLLQSLGEQLMAALPPDAEEAIMKRIRGTSGGGAGEAPAGGGEANPAPDAPDDQAPGATGTPAPAAAGQGAAADPSYKTKQRKSIDQLIESSGGDQSQ